MLKTINQNTSVEIVVKKSKFIAHLFYVQSQQEVEERIKEERAQSVKVQKQEESVAAEGEAMKNYCYYLLEKNGYVVVYLSDKETIYEYTSIDVETLPETVQSEVKNGKYIEDIEELYGFLENYSS